ncbi:hypothetical protein PS645_01898 [Pseudomonas fluorescens]|uniref:RHS repeat-associated core domain-containing protein n=1 Tax=Pseudomonas fluorescens TaxID=294 RepID=A0A5E6S8Y0_PSEFL|nr:RHS repeat-associated core domain-containing protein [Pseudomonas fluorescens]VVM73725.1 hypothetical protein PS645_01898 [Pseudomonas fluorescens]
MVTKTSLSYDALDRLVCTASTGDVTIRSFYSRDLLDIEVQGDNGLRIVRSNDCLLAQHLIVAGEVSISLLATDLQRSVLCESQGPRLSPFAYSPYGHRCPLNSRKSLLAFNGERPNLATGDYLLGNGHRAYNPALMRFNSPDKLSPFGRGGMNVYAYCKGDPVNFNDPTGQFFEVILQALNAVHKGLKFSWKSYSLTLKPAGSGLACAATVITRAGYITTAVGWGVRSSGYAVGQPIAAVGAGLVSTGKVLKLVDKLANVVRTRKFADGLRVRYRQLRWRREKSVVADPEVGRIRRL